MHYTKNNIVWQHGPTRQRVVRSVQLCRVRQTVIPTAGLHPGAQPAYQIPPAATKITAFTSRSGHHHLVTLSQSAAIEAKWIFHAVVLLFSVKQKWKQTPKEAKRFVTRGSSRCVASRLLSVVEAALGEKVSSCWLGPQWRHVGGALTRTTQPTLSSDPHPPVGSTIIIPIIVVLRSWQMCLIVFFIVM